MPPAAPRRSSGKHGLPVTEVYKVREGRPHIIDRIKSHEIALLVNTPEGRDTPATPTPSAGWPWNTTSPTPPPWPRPGPPWTPSGPMKRGKLEVKSLQEYHAMVKKSEAKLRAVKG